MNNTVTEPRMPVCLFVPGRGNTLDGITKYSREYALAAAGYLNSGKADYAITSGYGQEANGRYPMAEAHAMQNLIIRETTDGTPWCIAEPQSTNTFENALNSIVIIERLAKDFGKFTLAVVARKGHAHRAGLILKHALPPGLVESVEVWPTDTRVCFKEQAMETALYELTAFALWGVRPGNREELLLASEMYNGWISYCKNNTILRSMHPGR